MDQPNRNTEEGVAPIHVITRKEGQRFFCEGPCVVEIVRVKGNYVRVSVRSPYRFYREELVEGDSSERVREILTRRVSDLDEHRWRGAPPEEAA